MNSLDFREKLLGGEYARGWRGVRLEVIELASGPGWNNHLASFMIGNKRPFGFVIHSFGLRLFLGWFHLFVWLKPGAWKRPQE